jgi:hypothetical protein
VTALATFACLLSSALATTDNATCGAEGQLHPNLSYVDKRSATLDRFRDWVNAHIAAGDGNVSPADAVILADLAPDAKAARPYCAYAVETVDKRVKRADEAIARGEKPEIARDSYLEVGPKIADLSLAFARCSLSMSDEQRADWKAFADQSVSNIWDFKHARWGAAPHPWTGWAVDDPANNYHFSFLEATMFWALASGDSQRLQELCTKRLPRVEKEFAQLPGGGSLEGTAYGTAQMRLFGLYRTWLDATGIDLANANSHLTDTIAYWVNATVPTLDRFAPIGDQARVSIPELYDYQRRLMLEARNLTSDESAKALASWWLSNISVKQMRSGENFRYDLLPATSRDARPAQPTNLTYYARGVGDVFARSDWSRTAMWMAFIAGNYSQSHAHQEQGAFTLFQGDWLAVTENIWSRSGIQQGTETNNVIRFVRNGKPLPQHQPSHAVLTIDADDPSTGAIAATADLSPVYSAGSGVHAWKRSINFSGRKLVVHDTFSVGDDVHPIFQVDVPQEPVVGADGIRAGALLVHVLEPADAKISLIDWKSQDPNEFRSGWRIDIEGGPGNAGYLVELSAGKPK